MTLLELPIFPLDLVLFPGTPQLLHIFEPRYRQMLADCLEGDRRFGIQYLASVSGTRPDEPEPGDLGCVAAVRETRLLADGRSNALTVGETRYVMRELVETELPYLVARVEPFDDDEGHDEQSAETTPALRALFARFLEGMQTITGRPQGEFAPARDAKMLSFQIAAALEVDPPIKLELLGMRSTAGRLAALLRILRPLTDELDRRVAVHTGARRNGKGGTTRDIVRGA